MLPYQARSTSDHIQHRWCRVKVVYIVIEKLHVPVCGCCSLPIVENYAPSSAEVHAFGSSGAKTDAF